MKIYTTKFNANEPTNKQINIPNFSTAKIGVQVEKNGQIVELSGNEAKLVQGNTVISSDGNYNGFATFPITTGNENEDNTYILSCSKQGDIITPEQPEIITTGCYWENLQPIGNWGFEVQTIGQQLNYKNVYVSNIVIAYQNSPEVTKVTLKQFCDTFNFTDVSIWDLGDNMREIGSYNIDSDKFIIDTYGTINYFPTEITRTTQKLCFIFVPNEEYPSGASVYQIEFKTDRVPPVYGPDKVIKFNLTVNSDKSSILEI